MFTKHSGCQFFQKFKPFLASYFDWPCGYQTFAIKGLHSFNQINQKRCRRQINVRTKKLIKSIEEKNVEPRVYTRDTITKISNILRYSTWDSAQQLLQEFSIRWDSYTVNQVLKTHPPMEKAWLFFNWAAQLKGFKHDQYTYTTMMDIFGEARRISSMIYVFQQMQEKGIKIDAVTYTSLLHWLSNDGDVESAVKMWTDMKANGCHPTVVSYTAYLKVLFNHNRVSEAIEIYKEMLQEGLSPNCHTYTVLMEHLAGTGKFHEVMEIFNKMQEAGVYPDKATCNILVEKCYKARETRAMIKILHYMKENSLVLRYPIYLEALETLKISGNCDDLLRQVHPHFSLEPTYKIAKIDFNAVATGTCSPIDQGLVLYYLARKNFVAVDYLLTHMMDKNTRLDSGIISAVIVSNSAHCRLNGALLAFDYGSKMGLNIGRAAYLALIGVFTRTNSFPKVVEIVEDMIKAGLSLGTHLTALLIYRLGSAKNLVLALRIFKLLPDDRKCSTSYTALIGAYFFSGLPDKGLEAFDTMRRNGVPATIGTYNVLLDGLERCGKLHELDSYRKEKKNLEAGGFVKNIISMEELTCNLLFAGDVLS